MDSPAGASPDSQTLLIRRDGALESSAKEVPAAAPMVAPTDGPSATLCPRCGSNLVNPDGLGWCSKCGYCRSLEEGAPKVAPTAEPQQRQPSPLGVVEFLQLLGKMPPWLKMLLAGAAVVVLVSFAADFLLAPNSLARAIWGTLQLGLGLVGLLAAHVWALALIAPDDDQLTAKDVVICSRLWGLTLSRLPKMRKQVWLGGWSISGMACAAFVVGGFSYWAQFYQPKRVADKNLIQAISDAAKGKGKDKSLEDALNDFAGTQDLTKKKDEDKDKNQAKVDRRPTIDCVVIGYVLEDEETLSGLVVATLNNDKLKYAGVVRRGFTPQTNRELLKRLVSLQRPEPFLPGLTLTAIWVKPEVLCEVHQSGYDEQGYLRDPNFKGLLQQE
jgi:hypothetical protein